MRLFKKRKAPVPTTDTEIAANKKLEVYNTALNTAQTTDDPKLFFSNLETAFTSMEELILLVNESDLQVQGANFEKGYRRLSKDRSKIIDEFLQRYYDQLSKKTEKISTPQAKASTLKKGHQEIMRYSSKLEPNNISTIKKLWQGKENQR